MLSSSAPIRISSLRVPDATTLTAGKMRLSAIRRSRMSSIFPVPLNSSKITSSIRDPVSTSAVARMVSDPPSSILRAAPKNFFGGYNAAESTPPERMRPEAGAAMLYARPRRVIESRRTTTSWPISTSRFARSIASSAIVVWSSAGRSKVEAITSPLTLRCISVTSSGRSSTRTTIK